MYVSETMQATPETAVLFSALQLAEDICGKDLALQAITWKQLDEVLHGGCNGNPGKNHDSTKEHRVLEILTYAINEIIEGVEYTFSKSEQEYWRYQITTILLMLSMKEDIVEEDCSDLNNEDRPVKEFELLEIFPALSLDLAFKLITSCNLEVAFIDVIQGFDLDVNVLVLSGLLSNLTEMLNVVNDGQPESRASEIAKEYGCLLNSVIGYLFLHSNGLVVKAIQERTSDCDQIQGILDQAIQVMSALLSEFSVGNYICNNENDTELERHPYIMTTLTGLVNYAGFLETRGFLVCFDVLNVGINNKTASYNTVADKWLKIKESLPKYPFSALDKNIVMLDLLETSVREDFVVIGRDDQTVKMKKWWEENASRVHDLRVEIIQTIKKLMNSSFISNNVDIDLGFSKDPGSVFHNMGNDRWSYSCSCRLLLQAVHRLLMAEYNTGIITGMSKEMQCLLEVNPVFKQAVSTRQMSFLQLIEQNVFIIGERLKGYGEALDWMLKAGVDNPAMIDNATWLKCMVDNSDLLQTYSQAAYLLDPAINDHEQQTNSDIIKTLFLEIFSKLTLPEQNQMMEHVYTSVSNIAEFFSKQNKNIRAQLTGVMNRMVGSEEDCIVNDTAIVKEFSILAVQDPVTVLQEMLSDVMRNGKHCELIVNILQKLPALCNYCTSLSGGRDSSYLSHCIGKAVFNVGTASEKADKNLVKFIGLLLNCSRDDQCKVLVIDRSRFLNEIVVPLLSMRSIADCRGTGDLERYIFAAKLLRIMVKSFECDHSKKGWHILTESLQPFVMVNFLCVNVDKVSCRLENTNISDYGLFSELIKAKSVLVNCINSFVNILLSNVEELNQTDVSWLYNSLSSSCSCWYSVGYVMPLFCTFTNHSINEDAAKRNDRFPMYIPKVLEGFLKTHSVDSAHDTAESHSQSDNIQDDSRKYAIFAFNNDHHGESSSLHLLLRLCCVSDYVSEKVIKHLKPEFIKVSSGDLVVELIKLLPNAMSEEWGRVHLLLTHFFKDKSIAESGFDIEMVKDKAMLMIIQCLCIMYDVGIFKDKLLLEQHVLKGFISVYSERQPVMIQGLEKVIQNKSLSDTEVIMEVLLPQFYNLSLLVNNISDGCYDQMMSVFLGTLDSFECLSKLKGKKKSSRSCYDYVIVLKSIVSTLPPSFKNTALKKITNLS